MHAKTACINRSNSIIALQNTIAGKISALPEKLEWLLLKECAMLHLEKLLSTRVHNYGDVCAERGGLGC
jgi:hypothetical protein